MELFGNFLVLLGLVLTTGIEGTISGGKECVLGVLEVAGAASSTRSDDCWILDGLLIKTGI